MPPHPDDLVLCSLHIQLDFNADPRIVELGQYVSNLGNQHGIVKINEIHIFIKKMKQKKIPTSFLGLHMIRLVGQVCGNSFMSSNSFLRYSYKCSHICCIHEKYGLFTLSAKRRFRVIPSRQGVQMCLEEVIN